MTKKERLIDKVKRNKKEILIGAALGLGVGLIAVRGGYRLGKKVGLNEGYEIGLYDYGFPDGGDTQIREVFKRMDNHTIYTVGTGVNLDGLKTDDLGKLGERFITEGASPEQKFTHFIAMGKALEDSKTE